jgi:hypothetical protein
MANKVLTVLKDVEKVVVWPFSHLGQVIAAINTSLKAEPAVKTAVVGLLGKIQTLSADATAAATADGLNVPADMATASAAATLFTYVKDVFLPQIEAAYKDVTSSVKAADPAPTTQPVS